MKGQQISPWTFLYQNIYSEPTPYNLSTKNHCLLPKLNKNRQSQSKQQESIKVIFNKRAQYNAKTLVLQQQQKHTLQRYNNVASSLSLAFNNKQQKNQVKDDPILNQQGEKLAFLCQMKLMATILYQSLASQLSQSPVKQQIVVNHINDPLSMEGNKIPAINIASKEQLIPSNRIHNRDAELKMSAIRQLIKRDREGLNLLKKKIIGKKNEQLQSLKNKLTSNY